MGISCITLGCKDLYHDNQSTGINYNYGDALFLDGKRLILKTGYGKAGSTYTVEGDPFTIVTQYNDRSNISCWFSVKSSDGKTYQFGNTIDSRLSFISRKGVAHVAAWYINQSTDVYSNLVRYHYTTTNYNIRPVSIEYGLNTVKGRSITNLILFNYTSLPESYVHPFAIGDRRGKMDVVLSKITTQTNGTIYRTYHFTYDTSSTTTDRYYRLTKIGLSNSKDHFVAPINIQWNYLPLTDISTRDINVKTNSLSMMIKEDSKTFIATDINNDGISDIIRLSLGRRYRHDNGLYEHRTFLFISLSKKNVDGNVTYETPSMIDLDPSLSFADLNNIIGGIRAMDFDGDGYNDLIIPYYCGYKNNYMEKYAIRYGTLSAYPVNNYTIPLHLVSKVSQDNGVAGNQEKQYKYGDLRLHISGKGVLGFSTMTTENLTLGSKETVTVDKWDTNKWVPLQITSTTTIGRNSSKITSYMTIANTFYGENYFVFTSKKTITDMDGNFTERLTTYDTQKGVPTLEIVKNDGDNMYKKISFSGYQNKSGIWLPTTLTMSQKHKDDSAPFTTITTYSYDDKGNVLTSTVNSGTEKALKTTSTYDVYGNLLSSVSTGQGVKSIMKHNDYDASGRFVIKSYTNPSSAINTFTYDIWGNVLTESDNTDPSNILTTKHTYDGWGTKLMSFAANGTQTTYETGWGYNPDMMYYVKEATVGKPTVTTWYDTAGHEVLLESTGPKRVDVGRKIEYNEKGEAVHVYTKNSGMIIKQNLTYDERGRVITDVSNTGKSISYAYGNRSVTSTIAGRSYTKITDAWGNVVKATDPIGEVTYTYFSNDKPRCIKTYSSTVTMIYDVAGYQTSLTDPDAGTSTYTYAADGTLLTQTDGRGIKTINTYDELGRLSSTQKGQKTITNVYGTVGNEKLRLVKQVMDNNSIEYTHDKFGRVLTERRNIGSKGIFDFSYEYNSRNQLAKISYPGGLSVTYQYDDIGFKTEIVANNDTVYKLDIYGGWFVESLFKKSLRFVRILGKTDSGYSTSGLLKKENTLFEQFKNIYEGATGNLLSHQRNQEPIESFEYDELDRLASVRTGNTEKMKISYAPNGNILFKTGIGNYNYNEPSHLHAVTEVDNADGNISIDALTTSFNDLGKIQQITDTGKNMKLDFVYGPDQERWYTELSKEGIGIRSTIYAGQYEKVAENGITREFYYLDGSTIVVKEKGMFKPYLAFTDNQNNILSVVDENGTKVFDASYDAWGRQTVTLNTIGLHRGYTGHEMLNEFDIINMNGRLYDPVLGRFFSPDNYVQMPDNSQSFNRYSYCLNNPLKYTDPSGELFGIDDAVIAFAVFNMASSMMQASFEGKSVWKAGALSLLSSAASYGIGEVFKGTTTTFGKELLRAGAHGLASGVVSALDGGNFASAFVSGAAASGIGSYAQSVNMNSGLMVASTTAMGGAVAWATGGDFLQGALQGMTIGLFNHAMHDGDGEIRYYHDKKW